MTEKGVEFETVELSKGVTAAELARLLTMAGLSPRDALRTNEAAYREHVAGKDLDDKKLMEIMVAHPELIQRPLVVKGGNAVLARPVENLEKLGL